MKAELTIGQVAKLADVGVETIRYYQRRGLILEPRKPSGGFRYYSHEVVSQIRFIRRAQFLGFTLEEISGLLKLERISGCAEARSLAGEKVKLIKRKITDLSAMQAALTKLIGRCSSGKGNKGCPIIETLLGGDAEPFSKNS